MSNAFGAPKFCAAIPASKAPKPFVVWAKTVIKLAALPSMPSGANEFRVNAAIECFGWYRYASAPAIGIEGAA